MFRWDLTSSHTSSHLTSPLTARHSLHNRQRVCVILSSKDASGRSITRPNNGHVYVDTDAARTSCCMHLMFWSWLECIVWDAHVMGSVIPMTAMAVPFYCNWFRTVSNTLYNTCNCDSLEGVASGTCTNLEALHAGVGLYQQEVVFVLARILSIES